MELFRRAISNTKADLVCEYYINYKDDANARTNVTVVLKIVSTGYYVNGDSVCYLNGKRYNPWIEIGQYGAQEIARQTYDVQHNNEGKGTLSASASIDVTASGYMYASGSGSVGLPDIPRASQPSLITAPNTTYDIVLGNKVVIHFNKKSESFTHKIQLLFDGYNPYLVSTAIGGYNWTWDTSLHEDEMYKKMPDVNKKEGTIRLYTYSGSTLIGYRDVKFGANVTNANPIFNNFEYECIDDKTLSLTGGNKTAIKSFSNAKAIIDNANKAVAQKGARIEKYKFVCGNKQIEVPYNDAEPVEMLLEQIENVTMNVYAIDSRGNSTVLNKTFDNFIDYEPINIARAYANRETGVSTDTILTYDGTFWNGTFGSVTNSIVSTKYEFKTTGATEWTIGESDITPNVTAKMTGYSFEEKIKGDIDANGFSIDDSFDLRITIEDALSKYVFTGIILGTAKPGLAIHKNGVSFGNMYEDSVGGKIQGLYNVGDIFISTVNDNPSIRFGGTWELLAPGKTLVCIDTDDTDFNEPGKTGGEKSHKLVKEELPRYDLSSNNGFGIEWKGGHNGNVGYSNSQNQYSQNAWGQRELMSMGGDKPHNNLQPYITVYMWKRIA